MSESSALPESCPQCGAALPSDATAGLCPRCILAQAIQPELAAAEDLTGLDVTVRVAAPVSTGTIRHEIELPLPDELTNLLPHGNYSVESFLGQGGMGAVYKGTQVRLKRSVAIKIMRRAMGKDHDFEQRFEREAQAMAKLNHPNIVSVIDYGEAGPDYLYIVMELVDGADMMDVIRGGQMTQEMALSLLPQICDALQFAHDHGIVHRDIKPSNIMLTRDGRIKMADFGLAKRFDVESSFRTQTGTGMGTPDYAAPEQFDPTSAIDHRADIYALGVMIYQMITGQLPRGVWRPPSQRAEVAPQWDAIVSRAMQSDPSDRYQQASEVKTDVSSIPLAAKSDVGTPARTSSQIGSQQRDAEINETAPATPAPPAKPKSKTPLFLGLIVSAVIISAGAFFALRKPSPRIAGSQPPSPAAPTALGSTSQASSPSPASTVSIPGLPNLPPLTVPPGAPGLVKEFEIKGGFLKRFMILPDNRRLLAFPDASVTLIDLESEEVLWTAAGDGPFSSALNQDGSRFVTYALLDASGKKLGAHQGARQAKITLRQSSDGRVIQTWMVPTTEKDSGYGFVALSPSGRTVVARVRSEGAGTSTFVCFEEGKSEPVDRWVPPLHLGQSTHAWREDAFISSGGGGGGAVVLKRGGQIHALTPEMAQYHSALSPDGNWLAASDHGNLGLWDLHTRTFTLRLADSATSTSDISFAGNDLVIMPHGFGGIRPKAFKVWDCTTGKLAAVLPLTRPDEYVEGMIGAPNGTFTVLRAKHDPVPLGGETNLLQIWRLPKPGQVHSSATAVPGSANAVSPSPNLPFSATSSNPASTSSPTPTSKPATPPFPPGQWVKLFTKAEDLPADLRELGGGVKWENGGIRGGQPDRRITLPFNLNTNYGVRATFRRAALGINPSRICLRRDFQDTHPFYQLCLSVNFGAPKLVCQSVAGTDDHTSLWTSQVPPIEAGSNYTLTFAAVGNRAVARYGEATPRTFEITGAPNGRGQMKGNEDVRDIEVINLDGLSEAEALKILGVDEQGTDVRGKDATYAPLRSLPASLEARAIRLWDSAAKIKGDAMGVKWEKEALRLDHRGLGAPGLAVRHLILRASILTNPDAEKTKLQLRNPPGISAGDTAYGIVIDASNRTVQLGMHKKDQKGLSLGSWKLPRAYGPDEWIKMEFRAIGDVLTVAADGLVLGTVRDGTLDQPGGFELYAESKGYFRDISYISLDGLPEAEALRILGVDEKGNDLRGKSSAAATIEPWLDILHDLTGLALSGGAERAPGGLRFIDAGSAMHSGSQRDGAVRMRATFGGLRPMLRVRSNSEVGDYQLAVKDEMAIRLSAYDSVSKRALTLREFSLREPVKPGQDYELELRVVGQTLTAKINGEILGSVMDEIFSEGEFGVRVTDRGAAPALVETLEVLNLDLPAIGVPSSSLPALPRGSAASSHLSATKEAPFINTLGMKFVPVPITGRPTDKQRVLFSIWETRVQDYEQFAKEAGLKWSKPSFEQGPTHPAVMINWESAQAFCAWLTERERKVGKLAANERYRLPSDHEWSCAVGIGDQEDPTSTPQEKVVKKTGNVFPWGTAWPPPVGAGNFNGEESAGDEHYTGQKFLQGYRDDFPATAPVGSFKANAFGLFDLAGNAREWCEDVWKSEDDSRVWRGSSFNLGTGFELQSSYRHGLARQGNGVHLGFRCVLATDAAP